MPDSTSSMVAFPAEGKRGGAANMQMIAERLNLSIPTVSRALRRVPGINPETRARVFAMAAQLGYRLPKSYRSQHLQKQTLRHVGVLIQTPDRHAPPPLYLVGMSQAAMGLNASLMVHFVSPADCEKLVHEDARPPAMQSSLLDGVIFVFRWPAEVVRAIHTRLRAVSIMHRYPGVDLDLIEVANHEGVQMLATHLHELGHRRIGFLGYCGELHWSTARFGGYVAALRRLGIRYRPEWALEVEASTLSDPRVATKSHLERAEELTRNEGVTAWMCSTEFVAHRLVRWMTSRGLHVPEEVSVTGFHGTGVTAAIETPLTSVTASYHSMGAAALQRLLYRIQNPSESVRSISFPFEFFRGATTAAPRLLE